MKLGVMSDTHGHLELMRKAAVEMIEKHGVDAIIHLGDDSTDSDELSSLPVEIYFVPGIFEERYKNPSIPNRVVKEFEGISFLLTHTITKESADLEGDINPAEAIADGDIMVVLHGHSHIWRIDEEKGVIIINPGHLIPEGEKQGRERPPTYAVLDVTRKVMNVKIFTAGGAAVAEKTFFFGLVTRFVP